MPVGVPLTAEAILGAAEDQIRRYGPTKATVMDVARALGVSHAAVYKHFSSKQQLREAVVSRWLDPHRDALASIAADDAIAPPSRLRQWLTSMLTAKQAKAREDPELFAAYALLAAGSSTIAQEHVTDLHAQLSMIISDGIRHQTFAAADPAATARAVYDATTRFHHLAHANDWQAPDTVAELNAVCDLLLTGLQAA